MIEEKLEFTRDVTITRTARYGHFFIVIENVEPGGEWTTRLIDYDDNIGAVGVFSTESEAVGRVKEFLELAIPAYAEKHAKYGRMPVIKANADGILEMTV
jgi:hypothetical protein